MEKAGGGLKKVLGGLFVGIGATAVLGKVVKTFAGFEQTMANVKAVSGSTAEEMAKLSASARELGATTKFSAQEAGDGLLFLARAGFKSYEAIEALPAVLDLAAAAGIGLGAAADVASNVSAQFGILPQDIGRVADALVKVSNSANTDVSQLGEALKFVGPIAGSLGITLENTASAIGILGNAGIQGGQAGTNLRGILAALLKPTGAAQNAIKGLGLTLADLKPSKDNDFSDIFEKLADKSLTAAAAVEIFGRRNAPAALIAAANAAEIRKQTEETIAAAGAARLAAGVMSDTLSGAFLSLKSAVEEVFLTIGDKGLGLALRKIVDIATQVIRVLIGISDQSKVVSDVGEETAATVFKVVEYLKIMAGVLSFIVAIKFAGFLKNATLAMAKFSLTLIASPFGLVLIAVTALIAAFVKFKDETVQVGEESFKVIDLILGGWDALKTRLITVFDIVKRRAFKAWDGIRNDFVEQFNSIANKLATFLANIGLNWETVFKFIKDITQKVINFVIAVFVTAGQVIGSFIFRIVKFAKSFGDISFSSVEDFFASIKKVGSSGLDALNPLNIIEDAIEKGKANFKKNYVGGTVAVVREGLQKIKQTIETINAAEGGALFDAFDSDKFLKDALEKSRLRSAERLRKLEADTSAKDDKASAERLKRIAEERRQQELLAKYTQEVNAIADKADENVADIGTAFEKNDQQIQQTIERVLTLGEVLEEYFTSDNFRAIGENIGQVFGDAFSDIIVNFTNFKDVMENLARSLVANLTQDLVVNPISGGLSSIFGNLFAGLGSTPAVASAKGNAFQGGRVIPFANGGVVDSPGTFSLAGGRTGLFGEAGPEAILPLERKNGKLGVQASGNGGTKVTVIQNIKTNDASSFQRSKKQIYDGAKRAFSGGI